METRERERIAPQTLRGPARWIRAANAPQWTEYILCFLLGLVLAAAPIAEGPSPFGIAMLATLGSGLGGCFCLLGDLIGYYAGFGVQAGTQMAAGCVMVYLISRFMREKWLQRQRWYPAAIASIAFGITRVSLYWMYGGFSVLILVRMVLLILLCAAAAFCYADVADLVEPRTVNAEICRSVSVVFLLACLLLGLSRFVLYHFVSFGRILSVVILLILSRTGGPLCGAASGIVVGVSMDIGAGCGAYFTAAYALSGLISGLFSKHRKAYFVISFILVNALTLFCMPASALRIPSLIEAAAGNIVFLLLPGKWVLSVGSFVQPQRAGRGESGLRRYLAGRVGSMAHAYRALFDVASAATQAAENDADPAKVFDRAAERVCISCHHQQQCWITEAGETMNVLNDVTAAIQKTGMLSAKDFPDYFQERCPRLHEYTEVVNGELRLRAYRSRMQEQVREERAVLWDQYRDFSEILGASAKSLGTVYGADPVAERMLIRYLRTLGVEADASVFRDDRGRLHAAIESRYLDPLLRSEDYLDGLSAVLGVRLCMPEYQAREDSIILLEAEPLSASVGIAAVRKQGESVSGDRGTYFKTDRGELCVILSDGMGTGKAAAEGSIGAIRILENFLRAGVAPSNAMKLLNAASLVRDTENWGYATVDLMCIDLFSGDASFYKYGAAPSYVRTGSVIRKIRCSSYAAGLEYEAGKAPDVMRMKLKPGSVAVIASDGILSDGKDLWLRKLLQETDGSDMKALAGLVVQSAIKAYGKNDDMTALAIKVEVRT